jgi:hypothetical protein
LQDLSQAALPLGIELASLCHGCLEQVGASAKRRRTFIAFSITGAIVPFVGASATVIGPLVTIGLIALLRVGTNAWCVGQIE